MEVFEATEFGGPQALQLREEPDPTPGDGQVSVEVKAAGINFADVMASFGKYPGVPSTPYRPGYEVAGLVSKVGSGVSNLAVGDRVMGVIQGGGFATQAILDAKQTVPLPDHLDFGAATGLLIQGLTAYFLLKAGDFGPGKSVLVSSAAGGLGSLAIQLAKLQGAGTVIGLASSNKHDRVRGLGADVAVDYRTAGWSNSVKEATGGKGVDLFLDSSGDLEGEGAEALGYGAHWVIFGSQSDVRNPLTAQRFGPMIGNNITIRGYSVYYNVGQFGEALQEMIPLVIQGKLKIDVETFPFKSASDALTAIADRKTSGKVVLIP